MLKTSALKLCFEAIHWTGAGMVLSPAWAGRGVIFCLHHVRPRAPKAFAPNENLEITPESLDEIISLVKRLGYQLLSIDEALRLIKQRRMTEDRFAVFTLDDGYLDNLVHAMPVFERHKCPFTVYVAPRIAQGTCELWWRALEEIIAASDELNLQVGGSTLVLRTDEATAKHKAWATLFPLVKAMPEHEQRDWIRRSSDSHGVDIYALCRNAAMNWQAIRKMNESALATIGAHTLNHYNLLKLSEQDATHEIVESRRQIEAELGEPVRHFAYPYGNKDAAGPREFRLCAEAGYASAVVTRLGTVVEGHADHCFALPRIMVSSRYDKPRYIGSLISGIPGRLANRGAALNVG